MKRNSVVAILIFLVIICVCVVLAEPQKTTTGFYWPTGTPRLGNMAKFLAAGDDYYTGQFHTGYDIQAKIGDPIYAICDGIICYVSYEGWGNENIALVIEHKLQSGQKFYAIYGHIKSNCTANQEIKAGQSIGTIGNWDYGVHLHFGININTKQPTQNLGTMPLPNGWKIGDPLNPKGFVDPIKFITTEKPKNKENIIIKPTPTQTEKPPVKILISTGPEVMPLPQYNKYRLLVTFDIPEHTTSDLSIALNHIWIAQLMTVNPIIDFNQVAGSAVFYHKFNDYTLYYPAAIHVTNSQKVIIVAEAVYKNRENIGRHIFSYNKLSNQILKFDKPAEDKDIIGGNYQLSSDPQGNILFLSNNKITKYSPEGRILQRIIADESTLIGNYCGRRDLCCDMQGNVYILTHPKGLNRDGIIIKLDNNLNYINYFQFPRSINSPYGSVIDSIDIDSRGNIYLYHLAGFWQKFTPSGDSYQFICSYRCLNNEANIKIGSDGTVYIQDRQHIQKFVPE